MIVWLILSAIAGMILLLVIRKDEGEISGSAHFSFILSDIGVLPGGKSYREILEASLQPCAGTKTVNVPGKEVRVSVSLRSASRPRQACWP